MIAIRPTFHKTIQELLRKTKTASKMLFQLWESGQGKHRTQIPQSICSALLPHETSPFPLAASTAERVSNLASPNVDDWPKLSRVSYRPTGPPAAWPKRSPHGMSSHSTNTAWKPTGRTAEALASRYVGALCQLRLKL
jgi:hypothetical protein